MRVTYDSEVDAAYIAFKEIADGEAVARYAGPQWVVCHPGFSFSMDAATFVIDADCNGVLLGIEVLGASKHLPPELLANAEQIAGTGKGLEVE